MDVQHSVDGDSIPRTPRKSARPRTQSAKRTNCILDAAPVLERAKTSLDGDHRVKFEMEEARAMLRASYRPFGGHRDKYSRGQAASQSCGIHFNNAKKASSLKPVEQKVRTASQRCPPGIDRSATFCTRRSVQPVERSCYCDILGPHSCAECIKTRKRLICTNEADVTFPTLEVSQRHLCAPGKPYFNPNLFYTQPNDSKSSQVKFQPNNKKKARAVPEHLKTNGICTDTEIQLRVMDNSRHRGKVTETRQYDDNFLMFGDQQDITPYIYVDPPVQRRRHNVSPVD